MPDAVDVRRHSPLLGAKVHHLAHESVMPTVGLVLQIPLTLEDGHGRGPVGLLPVDKVGADAAQVTNVAVVLASEREWFGEKARTLNDETNFVLVDKPVG